MSFQIESSLQRLEQAGIGLESYVDRAAFLAGEEEMAEQMAEFGPGPYEWTHLICAMGGDEDGAPQRPLCLSLWNFDTECICDADSYREILERFSLMARGALPISGISAVERADHIRVRFRIGWRFHTRKYRLNADWVDASVISDLAKLLLTRSAARGLVVLDLHAQNSIVGLVSQNELAALRRITGLAWV